MKLKNKKILVTGADGFIGSHLTEMLLDSQAKVKAFCYYNSFNNWGWLDKLSPKKLSNIEIFTGDIRDPNGVRSALKNTDIVFHLAALIGIPYSYNSPENYVDTNIKGTLNILQASREFSLERILVTSTSEVYGTALYAPIDERHPLQAQSPYSATKIAADKIAESFYRSFKTPLTIVRPFNTYGPRQSARAIIPTIISQALKDTPKIKIGDLRPSRDFNYVTDVCSGFIEIAKSDKTIGEEINIASGNEINIKNLAEKIIGILGSTSNITFVSEKQRIRPQGSEVMRLTGCNKKIKMLTNWRPKYNLDNGLSETINWFKDNINYYKTDIYNV